MNDLAMTMLNIMTQFVYKVHFLLVSRVAWVWEHLDVVTRLHHIMAHKCVDNSSFYHVWWRAR